MFWNDFIDDDPQIISPAICQHLDTSFDRAIIVFNIKINWNTICREAWTIWNLSYLFGALIQQTVPTAYIIDLFKYFWRIHGYKTRILNVLVNSCFITLQDWPTYFMINFVQYYIITIFREFFEIYEGKLKFLLFLISYRQQSDFLWIDETVS